MLDVPEGLRQTAHTDETSWLESAHQLVGLVCRECGFDDLSTRSVLDVGCGTKLTKAMLDDGVPIGRYVGVDADRRIIDFLRANVHDKRFEFHHIDVKNDFYNPNGSPLADLGELPIGESRFDVIWLFSVFTHLAPDDYVAMLHLLRAYIRPEGWMVFSLFINELTDTGVGPLDKHAARLTDRALAPDRALARTIDQLVTEKGEAWFADELQSWLAEVDDETRAAVQEEWARKVSDTGPSGPAPDTPLFVDELGDFQYEGEPPDYVDLVPEKPLLAPLFSRRHAVELFDGTGWEIVALKPPEPDYIQHYFVCRPA
jgi:SAM-dependent methyltransferase